MDTTDTQTNDKAYYKKWRANNYDLYLQRQAAYQSKYRAVHKAYDSERKRFLRCLAPPPQKIDDDC